MNCLIIFASELVSPNYARLVDTRAQYALENHGLKVGLSILAGEFGAKLGRATVISVSKELVELGVEFDRAPAIRVPVDLVIAVPRPQTVKKVIGIATTMGIRSVHLLRTANSVKSYLQSPSLLPENIAAEVLKGLEQGCDTVGPIVEVHSRFRDFIEERLPSLQTASSVSFILETGITAEDESKYLSLANGHQSVIGAIGPESGWTKGELQIFHGRGFAPVGLGPRMLRVETAVVSFLAKIELMRSRLIYKSVSLA